MEMPPRVKDFLCKSRRWRYGGTSLVEGTRFQLPAWITGRQ